MEVRPISQTLFKIQMLLDAHSREEQAQARAFVDARYPCPADLIAAVHVGANAPVHEPVRAVQMNRNEPVFDGATGGLEGGFLQFWSLYPRKTGKKEALRIWLKLKPNSGLQDRILRAVREQITSKEWNKDEGEFIPHPKTWLNQERWDDEPVQTTGLTHSTDVSGLVRFAEKGPDEPLRPKSIRG